MKFKPIHFIINPASGREEPILAYINLAFQDSRTDRDISLTKKDLGAGTKRMVNSNVEVAGKQKLIG